MIVVLEKKWVGQKEQNLKAIQSLVHCMSRRLNLLGLY